MTFKDMQIRDASVGDAVALADLGATTFRETYASLFRPGDLEPRVALKYGDAIQTAEFGDQANHVYLATVGGRPVGFAKCRTTDRSNLVPASDFVHLAQLHVLESHHGRGIGSGLLKACIEYTERLGSQGIWLGVMKGNEKALRFYKRWGFRIVGEEPFAIGSNNYADLVMVLEH